MPRSDALVEQGPRLGTGIAQIATMLIMDGRKSEAGTWIRGYAYG